MRNAILFNQNNKIITGYDNVAYEVYTYVPDQYGYIYFVPVNGSHFSIHYTDFGSVGILIFPSYEMYNFTVHAGWGLPIGWYSSGTNPYPVNGFRNGDVDLAYLPGNDSYPFGNAWGRYWGLITPAYYSWNSTGNLGFKTILEYSTLASTMDNINNRNLTGTEVY